MPSVTRFAFFDGIHVSIYLHECIFMFCISQLLYVRWKQKITWTWSSLWMRIHVGVISPTYTICRPNVLSEMKHSRSVKIKPFQKSKIASKTHIKCYIEPSVAIESLPKSCSVKINLEFRWPVNTKIVIGLLLHVYHCQDLRQRKSALVFSVQ